MVGGARCVFTAQMGLGNSTLTGSLLERAVGHTPRRQNFLLRAHPECNTMLKTLGGGGGTAATPTMSQCSSRLRSPLLVCNRT